MANIGVAKASYYADLSVSKHAKESIKATERIAQTRTKISAGDQVSFSTMEDKLRLDIAAKSGAIRSMASAQAYLAATMNALESGEFILKQLHDIAVLASDDTKTSEELLALDTGAENLADEFHKLMTSAQYKGKQVFTETTSDMQVKAGLEQSAIDIGVGEVEYDDLYDHTNPALNSLSAGITYEIIEPLTDEQKETILARTSGLNAQQLQVGDQFTVISQSENEDGPGLHTNDLYYADDDGSVPFDATSKVSHASNFLGGYLDVEIDNNGEVSDNFDIISGDGSAGTITFNSDSGIVSYIDPVVGAIEIGEIDSAESEEGDPPRNGQNGEPLRINFYPDATIPGTSDLANGNFSGGSTNWNVYNDRVDFGSTFTVNGVAIPTPSEAVMAEATLVASELSENDPGFTSPPANDDAVLEQTSAPSFTVLTEGDDIDGAYLSLDTGSFNFAADRTMNFELAGFANVRTMEFELEDFANVRTMEFELQDFANVRTMEFELQDFANNTDMFSANLTIDFGSWTESGGTYTFSDNNPASSTNLNFTDKTVSEVVDLLDGVSGLTAELISNADNSAHTVRITSENTGFENGFRISGSGAATDERWTTPSVPTGHTYSNDFTRLASEMFSANLTIDFGSWTESGGSYTFSDSDPASSVSLNFNNKTLSEVIDLIEDVSGLTARLVSNPDNPSLTVQIRSEETGFQKGFRISGSGAATDERWTTPSIPTDHTYSNDFTQLAEDFHGSGVLHGPAMVSDEFEAQKGDILKLRYKAEGDDDWYHVASYIVDSSDNITMALNEWGKTTDGWQNLSVEVPKDDDNYRFVFVNGTWDQSNGRAAGALMYIDDVRAEDPYETQDSAVQQLMRSINYSSSSNDQEYVKNVLITANDGSTSISDTSRIFNTEYDEKIMVAPTLNLVNPVSLGASNTLGTDGSTDHSVVVSKIEEVQSRIETARSVAKAQYTVLESAIENATDMRAQFFWGADAISDPDFFADTAYFTKQQIMQDQAAAILAQANKSQGGLMKLVDT